MFPIRDHNPSLRRPYVTIAIILLNIAVYLATPPQSGNGAALFAFYRAYALIPAAVGNGSHPLALITYAFLHGGLWHLFGNMLFLWVFGDNLEDQMGHVGYAIFYLLAAAGAGLVQVYADPGSGAPLIGASGAVAGVMGGYLLLFPSARVDVFFFFVIFFKIFPIPAWVVLGVWFALQLFNGASTVTADGGVAYWAHVGGFTLGLLMTVPLWLRRGGPDYWQRVHGHPPHDAAKYRLTQSRIPVVRRRR